MLDFYLGKGGVGKTTTSLAAAASSARQGQKTLYLEIADRSDASILLNSRELTYQPRKLMRDLWGARITGTECLQEYLHRQIRVDRLYRLFFENRPVRYFFDAAPALRDLMLLGKIVHELDRADSPGPYERVVVDAPATGHSLFLFQTPEVVASLTRLGPIFERSTQIQKILQDPRRTAFHLISLPRPVVVAETLELVKLLRPLNLPLGFLYVNRVLFQHEPRAQFDRKDPTLQLLQARSETERREFRHLKRLTKLKLRFLPEADQETTIEKLADWFERGSSNE